MRGDVLKGLVHRGLPYVVAELILFAIASEPGVPVAALGPGPFSSQPDFFFKRTLWEAAKPAEVGNGAPAWCLALMGGPARWVFSRVFLLPLWK